MNRDHQILRWLLMGSAILTFAIYGVGCSPAANTSDSSTAGQMLVLPELEAVELTGEPLRVVATTSIIGDVVAQVGGDAIELTTLIGPGQDPHSYEPATQALMAVNEADVIFVNGWDLEEALIEDLEQIGGDVPLVPISANIEPLPFGGDDHAEVETDQEHHASADPHTWLAVNNVKQWVENSEDVLSDLDPAHAAAYARNAAAYLVELDELQAYAQSRLGQIAEEDRFLVTNHDSFGHFAAAYGFTILDTVIPAASTLAEPSASDLASLIALMEAHGVCTIVTETTASTALANTVAAELDGCAEVKVLQLYTGAVGPAGSDTGSYIGMFRANVEAIAEALQ